MFAKAQHLEMDADGGEGTCSSLEISREGIKSAFYRVLKGAGMSIPVASG